MEQEFLLRSHLLRKAMLDTPLLYFLNLSVQLLFCLEKISERVLIPYFDFVFHGFEFLLKLVHKSPFRGMEVQPPFLDFLREFGPEELELFETKISSKIYPYYVSFQTYRLVVRSD